jgi:energy-coupling factor transporter ATP-binding protein EcfA2
MTPSSSDSGRIVAAGLTKIFGAVRAVTDLSFAVEPGSVTGFLGPNGAGKTTTLRMILGLATPTSGVGTVSGLRYVDLPDPGRTVGAIPAPSTKSIVKTITHITDTATPEPSHVGQAVKFTGTVNPNPVGGSVSWTDGGTAIAGCTARPVNTSTGRATCNVTFNTLGTHPIIATYSGDAFYAGSQSPTLNHMVT